MRVGSLFLVGSWAIQRRNMRDRNTNQNLLSFDNIFIHHFVESILKLLPIFWMDEPQPYGTSYIPSASYPRRIFGTFLIFCLYKLHSSESFQILEERAFVSILQTVLFYFTQTSSTNKNAGLPGHICQAGNFGVTLAIIRT